MIKSLVIQERGRAKNALQDYLANKLYIPKIYLDAEWNGMPVDVLAIDRAGVGDVHAVRIFPLYDEAPVSAAFLLINADLSDEIKELRSLSCHFRYLAIASDHPNASRFDPRELAASRLLAEDGVGRIGVFFVDLSQEEPVVTAIIRPERFRSSKEILELADRYVAEHTANWEIRE